MTSYSLRARMMILIHGPDRLIGFAAQYLL